MRIAVVGAGLAGLSATWYALKNGFQVTLFDKEGIGRGASGVSTGLLYPCPGKDSRESWRALEGMQATKLLLDVAEEALGRPVANRAGIFRPAVTEEHQKNYQKNQSSHAVWIEIDIPGLIVKKGLWIESGITVFSRLYLQGLFLACEKKGAHFVKKRFSSAEREKFDRVILAAGDKIVNFDECKDFAFRTAVGQSLLCEWKRALPFSLVSYGYISVTENPMYCQVGSTYEHTKEPDPKLAKDLLNKVAPFYPEALEFKICEIRAGKRIAPREGHQPIVVKVSPKTWVFTGLGSRGMLYHALLGEELFL